MSCPAEPSILLGGRISSGWYALPDSDAAPLASTRLARRGLKPLADQCIVSVQSRSRARGAAVDRARVRTRPSHQPGKVLESGLPLRGDLTPADKSRATGDSSQWPRASRRARACGRSMSREWRHWAVSSKLVCAAGVSLTQDFALDPATTPSRWSHITRTCCLAACAHDHQFPGSATIKPKLHILAIGASLYRQSCSSRTAATASARYSGGEDSRASRRDEARRSRSTVSAHAWLTRRPPAEPRQGVARSPRISSRATPHPLRGRDGRRRTPSI